MKYSYYELFNDFIRNNLTSVDLKSYTVPRNDSYAIDVLELCEALQLHIVLDTNNVALVHQHEKTILRDSRLAPPSQRYIIAKALGSLFVNHIDNPIMKKDGPNTNIIKRNQEILAEKFAKDLLMPRNLLIVLKMNFIKALRLDADILTDTDKQRLLDSMAERLCVPIELLKDRMIQEKLI